VVKAAAAGKAEVVRAAAGAGWELPWVSYQW
jgi:hypothetical protein